MATKLPYVLPFEDGAEVAAILLKAQGLPETEQIATKTELQQATAYLATLDNATMAPQSATVKRTTDNLQAQIDNIVRAPESGGDVGAEVYQARVGADGTNYDTLKERLDAEYDFLKSSLSRVADTQTFTSDTYIQNNVTIGTVVDLNPKPSSSHVSSLVLPVTENDVLRFSCWNSGTSAVSVGFLDSDCRLISKSNARFEDELYIVPSGVAYITLNNGMDTHEQYIEAPYLVRYEYIPNIEVITARDGYSTLGERLDAYDDDLSDVSDTVTDLSGAVDSATEKLTQIVSSESFTADTFISNNVSVGDMVDINPSPSSSGVSSLVLPVKESDVLKFSCWNKGQSAVSVGFLDAEYRLISKSDSRFVDEDYIVPHGVAYVTFNNGMRTHEQHIENPYANRYTAIPNGEVIAARSTYATLGERLDAIEIGGQKGTIRVRLDEREICEYYGLLSDGTEQETSYYSLTGFIAVIPNSVLKFKGLILEGTTQYNWGYCFYDSNKSLISGETFELGLSQTPVDLTVTVPSGARYFRTTYLSDSSAQRNQFYIELDATEEKDHIRTDTNSFLQG